MVDILHSLMDIANLQVSALNNIYSHQHHRDMQRYARLDEHIFNTSMSVESIESIREILHDSPLSNRLLILHLSSTLWEIIDTLHKLHSNLVASCQDSIDIMMDYVFCTVFFMMTKSSGIYCEKNIVTIECDVMDYDLIEHVTFTPHEIFAAYHQRMSRNSFHPLDRPLWIKYMSSILDFYMNNAVIDVKSSMVSICDGDHQGYRFKGTFIMMSDISLDDMLRLKNAWDI